MMSLPDRDRAVRVCGTCKARKKACDKGLPSCGYCQKKRLVCDYSEQVQQQHREGSFPAWHASIPASSAQCEALLNTVARVDTLSSGLTKTPADNASLTFEGRLHLHVCRILEMTELSVHTISENYFRDFHCWLPILTAQQFNQTVLTALNGPPPPADFSVLLFAMCLIVFDPSKRLPDTSPHPDELLVCLKMVFARVQAVSIASLRLVQSGVLISAYEYARDQPEAAFISIGTCARMASMLGLDRKCRPAANPDNGSGLEIVAQEEEWNTLWGIAILERIILFETVSNGLRPMSQLPGRDDGLPSSLGAAPDLHALAINHLASSALHEAQACTVSSFGCQAEAILLLDGLLQIITIPSSAEEKLPHLVQLDEELQQFLVRIMREGGWVQGLLCGSIATTVRSLFLLHQSMIDLGQTSSADTVSKQREMNSRAALDTAAQMMADVAHDHLEFMPSVDSLPLCCAYNLRTARKHLQKNIEGNSDEQLKSSIDSLLKLEGVFKKRWQTTNASQHSHHEGMPPLQG